MDRWGDVRIANPAAGAGRGLDPAALRPPLNIYRACLHPGGLAPRIGDLAQWREHLLPAGTPAPGDNRPAPRGAARQCRGYRPPRRRPPGPGIGRPTPAAARHPRGPWRSTRR
ncbi:hypothetical protein HBB16_17055 [Pseudonocardia sp. MCCB 268]|nr:hypothetical protein [Pseudonocardia cytotoxica]